jgi:hypothetical protein
MKQSTGSCPDPHEMTVHFGMRVWCLVFWPAHSDTHGQAELAVSQKSTNGKLRTLQKNRRNLAPWLCAQVSHGSLSCLREESGRWESHLGAHFGIISLVCRHGLHPHRHPCRPSQSVWTKKDGYNTWQSPCRLSSMAPCTVIGSTPYHHKHGRWLKSISLSAQHCILIPKKLG